MLEKRSNPADILTLERLLAGESDAQVRQLVKLALIILVDTVASQRNSPAMQQITELLDNSDSEIRIVAVRALDKIADTNAISVVERLLRRESDPEIRAVAQNTLKNLQRMKREAPCSLASTVTFSDDSAVLPNNALDAGERRGELKLTVINSGQGIGFEVKFVVSCDDDAVMFEPSRMLGDIEPNAEKTMRQLN